MELTLIHEDNNDIAVLCNGQLSHMFDMQMLPPPPGAATSSLSPLEDPVAYGSALYEALCAPETLAQQTSAAKPERFVLTIEHAPLQALPWEYMYRQQSFLVLDIPFVRSIPVAQRIAAPTPTGTLHSAVLLSNPITASLPPLHTEAEWQCMQSMLEGIPNAMTLERVRPPTQKRLVQLLDHRHAQMVHCVSNMLLNPDETVFPFEHMDGSLDAVSHGSIVPLLPPTALMFIIHAGNTLTPTPTPCTKMAANLGACGIPYVLVMHFSMPQHVMHRFTQTLYREMACGLSVEAAVHQARLAMCNGSKSNMEQNHWTVGVPVLYTALNAPAPGLPVREGAPRIRDQQPRKDISRLPYTEGRLEGRTEELLRLGQWLTGKDKDKDKDRSPILTILGDFGLGKTTLVREAIERFGYAWPDGIWATSLEDVPSRAKFVNDLGQFLGIATERIDYATEVEYDLLTRLKQTQPLIVLDCAETLMAALHNEHAEDHAAAQDLINLIQEHLLKRHMHLLVMSRVPLGLAGEETLRIRGLSRADGARLFAQYAGHRQDDVLTSLAEKVRDVVAGNPLCLRLLGGAFATCPLPLSTFVVQLEAQMMQSQSEYLYADHAQQALFACIDTNVRYLSDVLRDMLSGLWVFHAPFLPRVAAALFDEQLHDVAVSLPGEQDPAWQHSMVYDHLEALWQRGLLEYTYDEDTRLSFYRMPIGIRLHAERSLAQAHAYDTLVQCFGNAYARLVRTMYYALHDNPQASVIAYTCYDDIQRGLCYMQGKQRADYLLHWAWIVAHMDQAGQAYDLTKEALMIYAHGDNDAGQIMALNNMAMLLHTRLDRTEEAIEHMQQALTLLEKGEHTHHATDYTPDLLHHTLEAMQESLQRKQANCSEPSVLTPAHADANKSATGVPKNTILGTSATIPQSQIRQIVTNTIAVMTVAKDGHEGWCRVMLGLLDYAQEQGAGWEPEVDFCRAVLALLQPEEGDHAAPILPEGHPYAAAIEEIQQQCVSVQPEPQHGTSVIEIQDVIAKTIAVFTTVEEQRHAWHATVADKQRHAQQAGNHPQAAFFAAILALLNEQAPELPDDHPYADALAEIITGIGSCRYQYVAALPMAQMEQIVSDTIAVMSVEPQRHAEWRMSVAAALMRARHWGEQWMPEVEFFTAVLAILDGQSPTLPQGHLYAGLIAEVINGIEERLRQHVSGTHGVSPIPEELVPRTIAALRGGAEEKTAHAQYLATIATSHTDVQMMILKNNIQMALHGVALATMGKELQGVYWDTWYTIVQAMQDPSE